MHTQKKVHTPFQEDWEKLSENEAKAKIDDCVKKCHMLASMLNNKEYDRDLTRAEVICDPTQTNEYPPLLPEFYVTLLMQHTASTATKGAQEINPLHLHIELLTNFVDSHSLQVPKTCIQIHADLCQRDPLVCETLCGDQDHSQQQFGGGARLPLFSMPVVSAYDEVEDKVSYHRLEEQLEIVPDPGTQ